MAINLAGRVLDDTGVGLNNATVQAFVWGSGVPTATTTTANDSKGQPGYWSFAGLADEQYAAQVTYLGKVRQTFGPSQVQFNQITISNRAAQIDSSGNATLRANAAPADQSSLNSPVLTLVGNYDSNVGVGAVTTTELGMQLRTSVTGAGAYRLSILNNAGTEVFNVDSTGSITSAGGDLSTPGHLRFQSGTAHWGTLSHANLVDRTYTFPDATDTLVLLGLAQTLTNKTLTTPSLAGPYITGAGFTAAGQLGYTGGFLRAGDGAVERFLVDTSQTQTLTNKTLTTPVLAGPVVTGGGFTALGQLGTSGGPYLQMGDGAAVRTYVDLSGAQALTNKTLTAPAIYGGSFTGLIAGDMTFNGSPTVTGDLSLSSHLRFQSGTAHWGTLAHSNTVDRTYTFPDATDIIAMVNLAQTLTQKTLTNPTINAATLNGTLAGSPTFSGTLTVAGLFSGPSALRVHRHPYGSERHLESGVTTTTASGPTGTVTGTFTRAFSSPPTVVASNVAENAGIVPYWVTSITTTGFTVNFYNNIANGGVYPPIQYSWIAEGPG